MRFDTVIRNGTVVTATDTCIADIGINGDKISAIGAGLPTENAGRVLDAANHLVLPGGIDVHTHLDTCIADIGINGDKISAIGAGLPTENAGRVLDAANHLVLPGGIDVHTHLDMPFG